MSSARPVDGCGCGQCQAAWQAMVRKYPLIRISNADLVERISEIDRRAELAIESFGSAPAALLERLAVLVELQDWRREGQPLPAPPAAPADEVQP